MIDISSYDYLRQSASERKPDVAEIRKHFPILERQIEGKPMVYLDNTATSQAPMEVVREIERIYTHSRANVHRGVHTLSQEMTSFQEESRERVREFINADSIEEIVFTRGATESINLVANSFGSFLKEGDEIILTVMEHHANIVPWQLLRDRAGIVIKVVDINSRGELDIENFKSLFTEKTRLASFCHVSNVLGSINPVKEMTSFARSRGVVTLIDGAQAAPHLKIDVKDLDCDFYVFSAHKMYGPSGVGVLYGRKSLLEKMPPWQGGGEMISIVTFPHTTFADLPFKFEAGTPDYIGIAAFSKALEFINDIGLPEIEKHEMTLCRMAEEGLRKIPGIKIYGESPEKGPVISFLLEGAHPYDLGMLLDKQGVEVRTGHHCAMPLMERLGIPGTVRASFAIYNNEEDVARFISATQRAVAILS
ncbi:MAG: cysteine desulfurase [Muribaculaceae bacterium]|nr:cysteine desulfurase [Muribaculaceae bacterium]